MKKDFLLKTMLLLFALIAGSSSTWADNITYTFNSKYWEATVGEEAANWTSGKDGNQFTSGRGVQITTGVSGANATSPTSINNISKIVVTYSTNASAGAGSIVFQVGSGDEKSQNVTKSGGTTDRTLTYNFSPNETGKVKMTVNCTTNSIYVKSVTITYSDVVKEANGLAWSAASKDVTYSETPYNLPTLSNPHSLAVTYDSSDKSVATIDSEGNVTIKNVTGSTTISASTEGDATYAAGTVNYTLNVTRKVILEDGVFNFGFGEDYGSGVAQATSGTNDGSSSTWTSGNITLIIANRYQWNTDGTLRAYKSTSSYDASEITISCPVGKAITRIEFTGPYTGTGALSNIATNTGTYTVTSSSAIWTGAAQSVSFTASNSTYISTITVTYGTTIPVTIASSGYSTIARDFALDFAKATPAGLEAYVASAVSASAVTLAAVDEVPASTGVILKGTAGATYTIPVKAAATFDGTNKLKAALTATPVDANEVYVLKGGKFCKVTGASTVPAGKAYLLASDVPASALDLDFDFEGGATGIDEVRGQMEEVRGDFYDLQGRKVVKPTKGLYIVNGRKVIIK